MNRLKTVRMIWMRSFLLVITIVMMILTVFFFYMGSMIQQEELERSASENQFLKTVLDEKFMSVTNMAADMMYRPAQLFPHIKENGASFGNADVFRLVTELESHCSSNSIIEDIFIYYPEQDYIIGSHGPRTPETYYYFYNNYRRDGYETWRENLLSQNRKGFFLYENVSGGRDLLYGSHLKLDGGRVCSVYFKMDAQEIAKTLEKANMSNMTQFFGIVDYEEQIYAYSGDAELMHLAEGENGGGTFAAKSKEDFFISNQSSYVSSVYYLTVRNKSNVLKVSGHIPFILMLCLLLSMVVSYPAAFYLSGRNMRPLKLLMKKLSVEQREVKENEYDVIGQNLDKLINNYSLAVHQIEEQQRLLTRAFVVLVLNGEHRDTNMILFLASVYGVEFPYSHVCVVITDIADLKAEEYEEKLNGERTEAGLEVYHGILEERLVTILNFDQEESKGSNPATAFIRNAGKRIEAEGLSYRIAVGGVYQNLSGISYSYSEAAYVLDTSREKLSYYGDSKHKIGEKDNSTSFYEFQRHLMERNYAEAGQMLSWLFDEYLTNSSPVIYKYRKASVLQAVYDAVHRETGGGGAVQVMEQQCTEMLFAKGTPSQVQENIRMVLEQLAVIMICASENDNSLAVRAQKLIDTTYQDPMLGLACLAEKLNVSGAHLSRIFKREIGQGIAEYISRVRIDASKELIEAGEMNIKSIALQVGFSSDANFIRVFKKYENTTPGKYEPGKEKRD